MELSLTLARFWGITLFVICGGLLFNKNIYFELIRLTKVEGLVLVSGLLAVLTGAFLVSIYNVWAADYRGLLTLLGWLTLGKGVAVFAYPKSSLKLAKQMRNSDLVFYTSVGLSFIVGIYLLYIGFVN